MNPPAPQKEHEWLQQLVGEWKFESECSVGPDQPPGKFNGDESARALGGVWFICDIRGEMPGCGTGLNIMTLGYDPAKKRFIGSFIGSMMTNMWIYEGTLDSSAKVLTLDTEGPSFTDPGKLSKYQDIIEIKDADHRTLSSWFLGPDGKWHSFMTAHYRRKKS